mmetsp:Transcript_5700/g.6582  ORF Transcript_5700/g.6582 Transcript_5700/m.6582 type:complete len:84 (+) Transcript_5700:381-632(+)|eukprot:CAMPEP_0184040058 /NCGR_PEP_ID=MMETSP0955-20130417/55845_1 /TAXON_ID=627963 /ORGANISM="Aplanochytrium sp, Strain PBS07" /LENGTH=83 /DNA_ID=CAMNT_0026329625 /DNA_START=444 /DNA_END=695 /DNA_ORIENTATION=-
MACPCCTGYVAVFLFLKPVLGYFGVDLNKVLGSLAANSSLTERVYENQMAIALVLMLLGVIVASVGMNYFGFEETKIDLLGDL